MTLALLAGYQPAVTPVEPDQARQHPGDGPEAYCTSCGEPVGIFLGHGTDWRHFRGAGEAFGDTEVYETDHAPAAGWRVAATAGR